MRFLVDAQLPRRLCTWLSGAGHDVVHTNELPMGNRTPDADVVAIADREGRIVVTKDDDFVQSHVLLGRPDRLLLIATGNIGNDALEALLRANLPAIVSALDTASFVELGRETLTVHG